MNFQAKVIKRDGSIVDFEKEKIIRAINLSAKRTRQTLSRETENYVVEETIKDLITRGLNNNIKVDDIHLSVENVLWNIDRNLYSEYRSYNNYKKRFNHSFNNILREAKRIVYEGDKENANKDSCLNSTKMTLTSELVGREMYLEYELPKHLSEAHKNMDFYIHDLGERFYNKLNCCLLDVGNIYKGGYYLNGEFIKEPTTIEYALDQLIDIILVASSQQYGGLTIPEIDNLLEPYAQKSYDYYIKKFNGDEKATLEKLQKIMYKCFRRIQFKIKCVINAGGQTSFVTWTFGTNTSKLGRLITKTILNVRQDYLAIFPKLIYLYHSDFSGEGKINNDLYNQAIRCSMTQLYPDYCSAEKGYLKEVYDRTGTIISAMGCRAYLSPWYDENGKERYIGRANLGAVSLALPRYAIWSKGNKEKFFEILDKYFDYAMEVHNLTYEKLRKVKAKTNPLMFCEGGGIYKLNPEETIEKALDYMTYSIGYIGLTEVCYIMTGKHLHEDNSFAIEVLEHLNKRIEEEKEKSGKLIALYGTPSEGYCDKLLRADRELFGEISFVTDKKWYHNSFHVGSNFEIDALSKQIKEAPLFHLSNGGHIVYNEYPMVDNFKGFKELIDYAMREGLYYGVNVENNTCGDCGYVGDFKDNCPKCNSKNTVMITRCCGYLGFKNKNGDTRYNEGKNAEVENRVKHFNCFIKGGESVEL